MSENFKKNPQICQFINIFLIYIKHTIMILEIYQMYFIYIYQRYGSGMIIAIGGIKGGGGKSMIASNLCVMRSAIKKKVLLIDADEQNTISIWSNLRNGLGIASNFTTSQLNGKAIYTHLNQFKEYYDDIIIDVGGRDTDSLRAALSVAHIYLIPFKPRSSDIWTLDIVKKIILEMKRGGMDFKSYAIINQADATGSDNEETLSILKECNEIESLNFFIGYRKAFANATSNGLGVIEMKTRDKKAIQEIKELYDFIYQNDI